MRDALFFWALCLAATLGCQPVLPDDQYRCTIQNDCPHEMTCSTVGRCTRPFDAGLPDAANACAAVPTSGFGSDLGQAFGGFVLQQCDGTELNFYNDDFCGPHPITVLVLAAAWCVPCRVLADSLRETLVVPYESRGLRVIQVLASNESGEPATLASCAAWLSVRDLSGVSVVVDPDTQLRPLNPSSNFPNVFVVNEAGRIAFRENGIVPGNANLRAAVERELTLLGR